jgi:hypothetical protein
MDLADFVASALNRAGCVAECVGDRVEALLPPAVAASLGLPENATLRIRGAPEAGEVHAGLGSTLLAQICGLQTGGTHVFRAALEPILPKKERVENEAERVLTFQNGVGRMEAVEEAPLHYLAFDFRLEALSEERHEGLVSLAVDGEMGWTPDLARALAAYLAQHRDARRRWEGDREATDLRAGHARARALARALAREAADGFIARMARRLRRDTRRVEDYYAALGAELGKRRVRGREAPDRLRSKAEAIEAERRRRLHDLQRRHAVTLRIEPVCVLEVATPGLSLRARLHRRKNERRVKLGWNPITREFDRWLCEGCGAAAGVPVLCDAIHLLCVRCADRCPACARGGASARMPGAADRPPEHGPSGPPQNAPRHEDPRAEDR